jgi:hypothetical protein
MLKARLKPEHSALILVIFVFLFAGVAVLVEQKNQRQARVNFSLCPLCGQEVRP